MTMDPHPAPASWLPASIAAAALHFDGDQVELDTRLRCQRLPSGAAGQRLALQLLADDALLLAELPLGPLQPDAAGLARVHATLRVAVPAGQCRRKLSLRLAALAPDGGSRPLDRWSFALPRSFVQPGLEGAVRLRLAKAIPTLEIDAIHNPRPAGDGSGTLALEFWSLARAYQGGDFQGEPLGSITLGSLAGQQRWRALSQSWSLPVLREDSEQRASGHLTLMLREWTPAGYVTRDWRELDWPSHPAPALLSLNRCSTASLRSVPGVSDRLARTIVAARPFASVDELSRVRGMNARLLARLRDRIMP